MSHIKRPGRKEPTASGHRDNSVVPQTVPLGGVSRRILVGILAGGFVLYQQMVSPAQEIQIPIENLRIFPFFPMAGKVKR